MARFLLIFLSFVSACVAFKVIGRNQYASRISSLKSVPEWLTNQNMNEENEEVPNVTVRFINTIDGKDVVVNVPQGSNLLFVGDNAGVKLPRACRTGLCGSCTCEVQDPAAVATKPNQREGFFTIRACSTKCFVPDGMSEMVIDVYRMKKMANAAERRRQSQLDSTVTVADDDYEYIDPMARFGGDWEKEFRPQWELGNNLKQGKGQVGGASDPKSRLIVCQKCKGTGRALCYNCGGHGRFENSQCQICVGLGNVGCGYCRGTGMKMK